MIRSRRGGAALAVAAVAAAVWWWAPGILREFDAFRVTDVRVEGTRFMERSEAIRAAGIGTDASVWDDTGAWERKLARNVLVESARVRRQLPGTLVIEVRERKPIAFLAMPTLEPVDRWGHVLPIDPARHRLDLPVLRLNGDPERPDAAFSLQLRRMLAELVALNEIDSELVLRMSELAVDERGDLVVRLYSPDVDIRYRAPIRAARLAEGLHSLSDALTRMDRVSMVDLRFDGQVVVRGPESL